MPRPFVSDSARTIYATLIVLAPAFGLAILFAPGVEREFLGLSVTYLLAYWPLYAVVYLTWTHLTYRRLTPTELAEATRRESATRTRWWHRYLFGSGSATSLTLTAAIVAVALTIGLAQNPDFRASTGLIVLGFAAVAASWALMVYAFAVEYLIVDTRLRETGGEAIDFHAESPREFGDYLTLAVLASTMAATISAGITSREVWRLLRTNVLLAFAFNTVVVAMTVSLLVGSVAG